MLSLAERELERQITEAINTVNFEEGDEDVKWRKSVTLTANATEEERRTLYSDHSRVATSSLPNLCTRYGWIH